MNTIPKKRWLYAIAGVAVLLFGGLVYAWSVLADPIAADFPDWTKAQLSLTFTLVMIFFCLGGLIGGLLSGKIKPQVLVLASAILFAIGFFLASRSETLLMLYLSFGVLCGLASGFSYNAVMSSISRWFPDKQGLISGILLMGFGIGAFLIGKLYQAFTPKTTGAWRTSFLVLGGAIFVVLLLCAWFIRRPTEHFSVPAKKKATAAEELSSMDMMKRGSFWLFYLWAIVLSAAGLCIVSQAKDIAEEIGKEISEGTIATVVGLISIFNGIGRVISGWSYDKFGRSFTMQADNVAFLLAGGVLIGALITNSFALVVVGFALGGLAYGGVPPTNSAFASTYYGQKHYPVNYALINTNLLIASFGSTIAGALYDAGGSYRNVFFLICGLAAAGILLSLGISLLDRRKN